MELLEPTELSINGKTFVLGKFPATVGREILIQYPTTAMPKVGDYKMNEELMLKLMTYVAVITERGNLALTTRALVDNHVPDAETLMRIEWAMMEKNFAFFGNGKGSAFLAGLGAKVEALIIKTLTDFSRSSSAKN